MKAVVAAFNQEKALLGAFSVITNLRMELFQLDIAGHTAHRVEDDGQRILRGCPHPEVSPHLVHPPGPGILDHQPPDVGARRPVAPQQVQARQQEVLTVQLGLELEIKRDLCEVRKLFNLQSAIRRSKLRLSPAPD